MDTRELAAKMWEATNHIAAPPNSTEWWLGVAAAAERAFADEAEALVKRELGGREFPEGNSEPPAEVPPAAQQEPAEPTPHDTLPEGAGPRAAAHRVGCSRKAQTQTATTLTRRFRPSLVGYGAEDLQRDYPHVEAQAVLESFLSHHIAKGDTSKNWLEKFFSYAATAERIAQERAAEKTSTDSTGQPLDPTERQRRIEVSRQHEREQNEYIDQQIEREQQP